MERSLVAEFEKTYREKDYRSLPWFSARPTPWVARAVRQGWVHRGRSLDLGCGAGTLALWLAQRGFQATGLDASASAIAIANRRRPRGRRNPRFQVASALDPPFAARSFDLATDIGLLHTLSPAQRRRYARGLARVLRPGGDYLLTAFAREERRGDVGPPYRLSVAEVVDLFEPGFEVHRVETGSEWKEDGVPRSYAFHFRRRRSPQPPPGPIW
ncbi:MAG TPA: class I SAM-dependent methyltransferase [Thermoplasmata archaeon]|nr:class I SAM-dependent methyltransferase [Thermoplasmata archaeon]